MKKIFTLVELLVVIAIIMVLTGVLLPALSKSKNMVRQIDCGNNLKTLGTSTIMYGNDYNSYFPYSDYNSYGLGGSTLYTWQMQLSPYCTKFTSWQEAYSNIINTLKPDTYRPFTAFICTGQRIRTFAELNSGLVYSIGNYVSNCDIYKLYIAGYYEAQKRMESIRNPTKNGLLWDGINPNYHSANANSTSNIDLSSPYNVTGCPHNLKTNVLFADCHVESCKMNPRLPIATDGTQLTY